MRKIREKNKDMICQGQITRDNLAFFLIQKTGVYKQKRV